MTATEAPIGPAPLFPYAGIKTALIDQILARLPAEPIEVYVEPFIGSGAVFFALAAHGRLATNCRIFLSDADHELALLHSAIKRAPVGVYDRVLELADPIVNAWRAAGADSAEAKHAARKEAYLRLRDQYNQGSLAKGARVPAQLVLRHFAFNGLWRRNRAGAMNVPPRRPMRMQRLPSREQFEQSAWALRSAKIDCCGFDNQKVARAVMGCGKGAVSNRRTVVYLDPPYHGMFAQYTGTPFGETDQLRLLELAAAWHQAGATVIYSNAETDFVQDACTRIWPAARVSIVEVPQTIAARPEDRGTRRELLVTGAQPMTEEERRLSTMGTTKTTGAGVRSADQAAAVAAAKASEYPFHRLVSDVKVPITATLGKYTLFAGDNEQGKTSAIDAIELVCTQTHRIGRQAKRLKALAADDKKTFSVLLEGPGVRGTADFDGAKLTTTLEGIDLGEGSLPTSQLGDLLSLGSQKGRAALLRRFGSITKITPPQGFSEDQRAIWDEARQEAENELRPARDDADDDGDDDGDAPDPAAVLAAMAQILGRWQTAATTAANKIEKDLAGTSADAAGAEGLDMLRQQRDLARAWEQLEGVRQARANAATQREQELETIDECLAQIDALRASAAELESLSVKVDATIKAKRDDADVLDVEAVLAESRLQRLQTVHGFLAAAVQRQGGAALCPCPLCGNQADLRAALAQADELLPALQQAATASRQNVEVCRGEADAAEAEFRAQVRGVMDSHAGVKQRHETALANAERLAVVIQNYTTTLEQAGIVAPYNGPSSVDLSSQIAEIEDAAAAEKTVAQRSIEMQAARGRSSACALLKKEATRQAKKALTEAASDAEDAVNALLAKMGYRAKLHMTAADYQWTIVYDEQSPGAPPHAMCGGQEAALSIALGLAWSEAPIRILLLDDRQLSFFGPKRLRGVLDMLYWAGEQGLVHQVFGIWPAARVDHLADVPPEWTVHLTGQKQAA